MRAQSMLYFLLLLGHDCSVLESPLCTANAGLFWHVSMRNHPPLSDVNWGANVMQPSLRPLGSHRESIGKSLGNLYDLEILSACFEEYVLQ